MARKSIVPSESRAVSTGNQNAKGKKTWSAPGQQESSWSRGEYETITMDNLSGR
jgi:uncharacterized protein YjcR